jgi:signal transduction histidine kinase
VERSGRSNIGIIDRNGLTVYRGTDPDSFGVGKPLTGEAPGLTVLRTGQMVLSRGFSSPFDARRRMGAFIPIPQAGWVVGVTALVDEVLASAWKGARRNLGILLLVLAVSLLGAFILGQTILSPVLSLQQAALSISRGNLKARVLPAGRDEVATAAQAFNQMADRIMELEGDRTRFLQTAAYALRNPMTTAKGAISLLRQRTAAGEIDGLELREDLELLEREVDRLSSQLNEVMDAFCLREGQLSVWREPLELGRVVQRSLEASRMLYRDHRFVFEEKAAVRVFGDSRRLEDVIRALLANASQFSPPGTEIRVRLEASDSRALLSVSDQGIGIPQHELEKVFHPFFRGSNLEGSDPGGVGLGLYIAAQIVEDHGGLIRAESEEGRGSTFYVDLPRLSAL